MLKGIFGKKKDQSEDLLGDAHLVMQASLEVPFDFDSYANKHIFNKLSHKSRYGFYYFPYGYLFRYPKWGTINEMGFRMDVETYEVREKYGDCFIIAVFGGSTGFSILVSDEDVFTNRLEELLNNDEEAVKKAGKRFKVVNLSHPGNMLLNQIINYLLFCSEIRPDLVISHNGANDLCTLQMNDRKLVSQYKIGYCDVLEAWGRKIHDADDVEIDYLHANPERSDFSPAKPRNKPEDIIKAYHARVKQFARIVHGFGSKFISGFQPWITSKKRLTPEEKERLRSYNPFYQRVYRNMPQLMQMYDELLEKEELDYVVNLHRAFSELNDEKAHFGDVCHLLPAGDMELAKNYYKKVIEIIS